MRQRKSRQRYRRFLRYSYFNRRGRRESWEDPPADAPVVVQRVHKKIVEQAYDRYGGEANALDSAHVETEYNRIRDQWEISSPSPGIFITLIYRPDEEMWYYKGKRGHVEPLGSGIMSVYHWAEKFFRY